VIGVSWQICKVLAKLPEAERKGRVMCIDTDLEGSTGLKVRATCLAVRCAFAPSSFQNARAVIRFVVGSRACCYPLVLR
jgi:hypothetical protein